jgi:hypothetical protein
LSPRLTLAAEFHGSLHEGRNQGMGLLRSGRELRLEQGGNEKRMPGKFHRPSFAVFRARDHLQASGRQLRLVLRVDLIIAKELFDYFIVSVNAPQQRAGLQPNAGNGTAELGIRGAALGHRTGYGRNDDVLGLGIMFGAISIGEFQQVAGTL